MTSSPSLLLGACIGCGEPIFRHRLPDNRQISCEQVRQIDRALQASGADDTRRSLHIVSGDRQAQESAS